MRFQLLIAHEVLEKMNIGTMASRPKLPTAYFA